MAVTAGIKPLFKCAAVSGCRVHSVVCGLHDVLGAARNDRSVPTNGDTFAKPRTVSSDRL